MPLVDLLTASLAAINQPIQNSAAVANLLLQPAAVVLLALALVEPLISTLDATSEAINNVIDPDEGTVLDGLINFLPTVLDGFLNGSPEPIVTIPIAITIDPPGPVPPFTKTIEVGLGTGGLLNPFELAFNPNPQRFNFPAPPACC